MATAPSSPTSLTVVVVNVVDLLLLCVTGAFAEYSSLSRILCATLKFSVSTHGGISYPPSGKNSPLTHSGVIFAACITTGNHNLGDDEAIAIAGGME